MAVVQRRTGVALAVCFGALALPATASARHMSDMPWCPHSNVQGADPADQVPGAPGGSGSTRSGSEAPLGGVSTTRAPAGGGAGSTPALNAGGRSVQASTVQQATTVQQAAVATGGVVVQQAATATTAATPVRLADGRTVEVRGPVTAAAVRKARARARAQERREARGLAKARAEVRAERARVAEGARVVAQVQLTTPERWLAEPAKAGDTDRGSLPAIAGIVAALMAMAGLAVAVVRRRRRGGSGHAVTPGGPAAGPAPDRAAAIEAELQEIIAEERAARAADDRSAALSG
jgi:hypothetical protein